MIEHIEKSIKDAVNLKSRIDDFTLHISGMTNYPVKHLLNNIFSYSNNINLCEIGSYKGATLGASLNNNYLKSATSITWFSKPEWFEIGQFDKKACFENLKRANNNNIPLKIIDNNFYNVNFKKEVEYINAYIYDGPHGEQETIDGLKMANEILDENFLLIIDDFDDFQVKSGTFKAILDTKWEIKKSWELKGNGLNSEQSEIGFWNGVFIALIKK